MNRLKTVLLHPSLIGMYLKDKFYIPVLYIIFSALLLIIVKGTTYVNYQYFDYSTSNAIVSEILIDDTLDFKYENKELTASPSKFSVGDFEIHFNDSFAINNSKITLDCREEGYKVYFQGIVIAEKNYSSIYDFDSVELINHNMNDKLALKSFFTKIFDEINPIFATMEFAQDIPYTIFEIVVVIVLVCVSSIFYNPLIAFKVRLKIVLYCCVIGILVLIFATIFDSMILQIIAVFLSTIYARFAFSRIIKVRKGDNDAANR